MSKLFFRVSQKYGNDIYNIKGLSFHKSKYRVPEKPLYFASNSFYPSNDLYLAYLTSDITQSYFSTMGKLLWGIAKGVFKPGDDKKKSPKTERSEEHTSELQSHSDL